MGRSRSRSRSPRRERRRSRSRSRDRDRDRYRKERDYRKRSRSRSPRRRRSISPRRRSRSRDRNRDPRDRDRGGRDRREYDNASDEEKAYKVAEQPAIELDPSQLEGKSEEEIEMMKIMGFGGFETTKGKKVDGNAEGAANILQKRRYRQYMNRRGGFNRPLDFIA
ncbi:U4/U6.U5 small nuclear ribonucleoprotein 27 kDa protein-like [Lingula anatina]|uniref:U4/U6.U5 small nuclear ribonucleoprotein 27 kDa protein n=1 Tax=Lingula anatina TaxID=7574 RepID=A0A1S3II31_LINAN|nr:U4/U6.U5 small nuclear ribonucleoprotein 27 kDa protein [Lingula anatina]XP_013397785.1 U4/U6.U5 small nuclear ribonucleoprotein 27 kDa protein-like [Lingula anatina]|eukprot:XP_013397783.1 U4/U6.U5 small nuclear ribonucleoprotein 27 kDa protein [Lingula anatina]